jgi:aspartate aminotransferase
MPFLSDALGRIKPSPTVAITALAREMAAAGRDVITLSAGEPDFDTPEHVKEAAIQAMRAGKTKYTAPDGIAELKEAIARKFRRDNGLTYSSAEISVSSGGKQVLFNALMATLNPGDEVVIPAPYWVSYPDMVLLCGGRPVILAGPREQGYRITPGALEKAITPRSKWLIFNSPSNPTGAGYSASEIKALMDVVRRHPQLWVMSDDIYEQIAFPPFRFATPAGIAPDLKDRILTVNGVSKAYAMTGWRIGYAGGPAALIAAMRAVQSQTTTNPTSISQYAALAALEGPQDYVALSTKAFLRRRDLVVARLNAIPGIDCATPEGAFYVYPDISGLIGKRLPDGTLLRDDSGFVAALLRAEGVAVVQGQAFGLSPNFRVSYAAADAVLTEACDRIARFAAQLR